MAKKIFQFTRAQFREVARRRIREAKGLLDIRSHKSCDGATTCALLAAECALKATLLQGLYVEDVADLPADTREEAFKGRSAHDLSRLWSLQPHAIQNSKTLDLGKAIASLHQLHRYAHRYGAARPCRDSAAKAVAAAQEVVAWMEKEVN